MKVNGSFTARFAVTEKIGVSLSDVSVVIEAKHLNVSIFSGFV